MLSCLSTNRAIALRILTQPLDQTRRRHETTNYGVLAEQTHQRVLHKEHLRKGTHRDHSENVTRVDPQPLESHPHLLQTPLYKELHDHQDLAAHEGESPLGVLLLPPHHPAAGRGKVEEQFVHLGQQRQVLLDLDAQSRIVGQPRGTAFHSVAQLALVAQ